MCVRQRRAVICQSGVGGYGFQAWPPWCVTAGACGRCWERGGWAGYAVNVNLPFSPLWMPGVCRSWLLTCLFLPFPCTAAAAAAAFSALISVIIHGSVVLVGVFFGCFFSRNQPFDTRRSYGFSFALHRPRWGPSSQSDRGALPCFMPRAVAFNLALRHITENRCTVRPVLFKLVWLITLKIDCPRGCGEITSN